MLTGPERLCTCTCNEKRTEARRARPCTRARPSKLKSINPVPLNPLMRGVQSFCCLLCQSQHDLPVFQLIRPLSAATELINK